MHFSVLHYTVQKQKYLEKIGTNIAVRPLCTKTTFLLPSQPILLVLRALCLSVFVNFDRCFNTSKPVGGRGAFFL